MPDVDIDFCMEGREEVIRYVTEKYGKENVAQIITFGKMQAKAVIRDVGRVMGIPYAEVDRIAKLIPKQLDITLEQALQQESNLKAVDDQGPPDGLPVRNRKIAGGVGPSRLDPCGRSSDRE